MSIDELISEDDKPAVMRSLLLKHRHVNEHGHSSFHFGGSRRKNSSYTSLQVRQSIYCFYFLFGIYFLCVNN